MARAMRALGWICGTAAGIFLAYEAFLFAAHDFNPDYSLIDQCLDQGGAWNYMESTCEK